MKILFKKNDKNDYSKLKKLQEGMKKRYNFSEVIEKMRKRGLIIKHNSLSGLYASPKNDAMVWFESSLERDFAACLEFHSFVNRYEEQPLVVEYYIDENLRTYTPDFLVHFNASANMKPWLCEIKFRSDLRQNFEKYRAKFKAAIQLCRREGWEFKLITEEYIRTEFLENAQFLMRYKFEYVDLGCLSRVLAIIEDLRVTTPEEVMLVLKDDHFNIRGKCLYALWYAIKSGQVNCDLTHKITMSSEIWPDRVHNPNGEIYD